MRLSRGSSCRISAVHQKVGAGDEACLIAGQKQRRASNLRWVGEPPQEVRACQCGACGLQIAVAASKAPGSDRARGERIDPDAIGSVIDCHCLRQLDQRAFGGAIRRTPGGADAPQLRGNMDDAAAAGAPINGTTARLIRKALRTFAAKV